MGTALALIGLLLAVAATAVVVAAEFSFVAIDRAALKRGAQDSARDRILLGAVRDLSFQLSGAQFGITVFSLITGYVAQPAISKLLEEPLGGLPGPLSSILPVAIALLVATGLSAVLGELAPKNAAISEPLKVARLVAPLHLGFVKVFGPIIRLLNNTANFIVRRFGVQPVDELEAVASPEEIALLARTSATEGALPGPVAALVRRSLTFASLDARDAMTPRLAVATLKGHQPVSAVLALSRSSGHSRFPVIGDGLDDVVGQIELKDVLALPPGQDRRRVRELIKPIARVPDSLDLERLLAELRAQHAQLAVVIDEYGGTAGVVTQEDLIEELVGPVRDEYDPRSAGEGATLTRQRVDVDGLLRLDELDELDVELTPGPYATLGGFVQHRLGRLAERGDMVEDGPWRATVLELDRRRVARVRLERRGSA